MMAMSLITSLEPVMLFLGDWKCVNTDHKHYNGYPRIHWHYSWTHWLYIIMGVLLSIVQIARIAIITGED